MYLSSVLSKVCFSQSRNSFRTRSRLETGNGFDRERVEALPYFSHVGRINVWMHSVCKQDKDAPPSGIHPQTAPSESVVSDARGWK